MSKRLLISFTIIFLLSLVIAAPQKSQKIKIDTATVSAVGNLFRTLQNDSNVLRLLKNVQSNVMSAAVVGLALSCRNIEQKMELNLVNLLNDFTKTARESKNTAEIAAKLRTIDKTMYRDRKSLEVLVNAMDLATSRDRDYRQTIKKLSKNKSEFKPSSFQVGNKTDVENMINDLRERVALHLKLMKERANLTSSSAMQNLRLQHSRRQQSEPSAVVSAATAAKEKEKLSLVIGGSTPSDVTSSSNGNHLNHITSHHWLPPQLYFQMPIHYYLPHHQTPTTLPSSFESFYRFRRQNNEVASGGDKREKENQSEDDNGEFDDEFDASSGGEPGGGILGLIAGLSSNEGTDVGALAGLISTVVTNLLGPGGLDIPSVLSTGSSLISGLLSGGENFGKVVASYLGIFLEGLTGGGGAVSMQ